MIKKVKKKLKRKTKASKKVTSKNKNKKVQQKHGKNTKPSTKNSTPEPARDALGRLLPGNSGNPGGRPKNRFSLTGILQNILNKQAGKSKQTQGDQLMKALLKHAKKGSPKLMDIIMNRIDGKVPDHLITTDTGPLSDIDEDKLDKIINAGRNQPSDPE